MSVQAAVSDCSIKIHSTGDHRQPDLWRKHLSYICNQAWDASIISNLPWLIILHTMQCSPPLKAREGLIYPVHLSGMAFMLKIGI